MKKVWINKNQSIKAYDGRFNKAKFEPMQMIKRTLHEGVWRLMGFTTLSYNDSDEYFDSQVKTNHLATFAKVTDGIETLYVHYPEWWNLYHQQRVNIVESYYLQKLRKRRVI